VPVVIHARSSSCLIAASRLSLFNFGVRTVKMTKSDDEALESFDNDVRGRRVTSVLTSLLVNEPVRGQLPIEACSITLNAADLLRLGCLFER